VVAASDERDQEGGSKVRTVFSSRAERVGGRLCYCARGSGFLKYMVRNLVGTLLDGGKERIWLLRYSKS
jgi:tRNA U38,U39,U40 pseudouridine synthase TruA